MNAASNPDTLAQLAHQDLQNNQLAAAEAKCLRALNSHHQHRGALNVLGMVLVAKGRHEDAVRVFHALTQFEPGNADYWANLGTALRPTRRYDAALDAFGHALQLGEPSANLLYNIGAMQVDRCDYDAGYSMLSQALDLSPSDAGIRLAFAQCCHEINRPEDSLAALKDWQTFEGLTPEIVAGIAHLLIVLGDTRLAEPALQRLFDSARREGRSSPTLARILERVNRVPEAREVLAKAKQTRGTNSDDPDLLMVEAVLAERAGAHEEACRLLSLILKDHKDFPRRHHVLFPLAKSLDALGRFDEAYAALEEAHRSQVVFLENALGKRAVDGSVTISLARSPTDPADVATWQGADTPARADCPIFIVAFPRSGTTLLEQILDAHPGLKSMDETPFLKRALDDTIEYGIRYAAELGKLDAGQLQHIRDSYWQRVRERIGSWPGQRLVDKNPLNLMRLPLIRRLFPNAHIILAIRHPCDTLLSCFQQHFRAPDLALLCRDLPTLAHDYRVAFDFWYQQCDALHPQVHEIKYETLVASFETEVRRLAGFLQIPWNDSMLAPAEHALAKGFISTPSYSQVIQPINNKSLGRWKNYEGFFKEQLPVLSKYLKRWGYAN